MKRKNYRFAVTVFALAVAFETVHAQAISGYVDPTVGLDNSYLLYNLNAGSGVIISVNSLGSFPGNQLTHFSVPADPTFPVATDFPYAFLATTTDVTGAVHAVVSMKDASSADGKSFDTVFAGGSESQLILDLQGGFTDDLIGFYNTYQSQLPSWGVSTLEEFSNGASAGTVFATPVPEPCSIAVLGLGALALIRRRR